MMIAFFFVIIKVLIAEIILKIGEIPNGVNTEAAYRNVKNIGSIIGSAVIDVIKKDNPIQSNNTAHLVPELRVKPRPNAIFFQAPFDLRDEEEDDNHDKKKNMDLSSVFSGLYSKEDMPFYFNKKPL